MADTDERLHATAAARNGEAILQVLKAMHQPGLRILEIASGPGQHGALFAQAMPDIFWQASDPDPRMRASEQAWGEGLENMPSPLDLNVLKPQWWKAVENPVDMMLCVNMIHCASKDTIEGLLAGAGRLLEPGSALLLYGPFTFNGMHSVDSNKNFDRMLRQQNAEWGVRDLNDIAVAGQKHAMFYERFVEMPSNNHILVLRRQGTLQEDTPI
jgi:hypothetical protein